MSSCPFVKKNLFLYLGIFMLTVMIDQMIKRFLVGSIGLNNSREFIPGLINLTVVQNSGGAFSILNQYPLCFKIIGFVNVVIFSFLTFYPTAAFNLCIKTGCAFVLGGSLGNLIDRLQYGSVIDFIEPVFTKFAIFNMADVFINAGVILILIGWIRNPNKKSLNRE